MSAKMRALSIIFFAFFMCVGCVTHGNYFPSDVAWIKEGGTKQDDVKRVLGSPYMVGNAGGVLTWTYGYYEYRLVGASYTKELKFFWNTDFSVKSFSFNSSFPEDTSSSNKPVNSK